MILSIRSHLYYDTFVQYDFTGRADIIKFFQLVQKAGLYGILRIGPYVCAEWNYGYEKILPLKILSHGSTNNFEFVKCIK